MRYPPIMILIPLMFLGIAAAGFDKTITSGRHLLFQESCGFAVFGTWFLLYVLSYRTLFSMEAVKQRTFPGIVRQMRYADIERVKEISAGPGTGLLLLSTNGKKLKVYGDQAQIHKARHLLFSKVPGAFRNDSFNKAHPSS